LPQDNELCASFSCNSLKNTDTFHFERALARSGYRCVGGLDEAGRGPLAGPVVAGCVVLPQECEYHHFKDSKKLKAPQRQQLYNLLHVCGAKIGCAVVSPQEIDRINILQASLQAMARAVSHLASQCGSGPDFLLVDGKFTAPVNLPQEPLVRGESKSASIAAASIIAKVTRDRLMERYHEKYPAYNFRQNKGYPTADHRRAIQVHGPCRIHRRTFKGVREFFEDVPSGKSISQPELW
jgi:ribonuclease HII